MYTLHFFNPIARIIPSSFVYSIILAVIEAIRLKKHRNIVIVMMMLNMVSRITVIRTSVSSFWDVSTNLCLISSAAVARSVYRSARASVSFKSFILIISALNGHFENGSVLSKIFFITGKDSRTVGGLVPCLSNISNPGARLVVKIVLILK